MRVRLERRSVCQPSLPDVCSRSRALVGLALSRRTTASRAVVALAALALGFAAVACAPHPPLRWAEGGAALVLAPARWDLTDGSVVEILADGQVLEDGELFLVLDGAGRIADEDHDPYAVLLPDGYVAGSDQRALGRVGFANAAPPDSAAAWLTILPSGQVVYFDTDGERSAGGTWRGCEGPQKRACTLVTHLVAMRHYVDRPGVRFGIGVGMGFGF